MSPDGGDAAAPVIKVGLKRINLEERVFLDRDLRTCPAVRTLGEDLARELLSLAAGKRFADQARIFQEGDPGDALVFVLKGEVRLYMGTGRDAVEVAVARKGELLGEREALGDSSQRTFTAQATGEVELVEFPRAVLGAFLGRCPQLGRHLRELAEARSAVGAELSDFLNRW